MYSRGEGGVLSDLGVALVLKRIQHLTGDYKTCKSTLNCGSSAHPKAPVKQYASRPNTKKDNFLTRMRTGPTTPTQSDSTALHSRSTCSCHSSCRHLIWCCQGSQGLLFENLQFSFLSRAMCVIATRQVMCCWELEVLVRPIRLSAVILLLPHYTT